MNPVTPTEKKLFFSLWALLLIVYGIYRFWPEQSVASFASIFPPVHISEELQTLFESAEVSKVQGSYYELVGKVSPEYHAKLQRGSRKLKVGYEYHSSHKILDKGATSCVIGPERLDVALTLPNPKHIRAKKIRLFLAH